MSGLTLASMRTAGMMLFLTLAGCGNGDTVVSNPLPDWSDSWGTPRQSSVDSTAALQAALKPERLSALKEFRDKALADDINIKSTYCRPLAFGGFSGGFRGSIEFLFTPGRVTVISEGGLVRRLYTDGRTLPAEPEPSDAGTSVAHWEGQTLVVETIGLRPETPAFNVPGTAIGEHARVTERLFLKDADTLQVDATLDAPDLLNQPAKVTYLYHRERGYTMTEFTACPEYDRSVDPVTGRQRFDLSPPDDILPPPTE